MGVNTEGRGGKQGKDLYRDMFVMVGRGGKWRCERGVRGAVGGGGMSAVMGTDRMVA